MNDIDGWPTVFTRVAGAVAAAESLVERVRDGSISIDQAHAEGDGDAFAGRVFAVKVYEAIPGIGKVKARRAMAAAEIDEDASLASLTETQRHALAQLLAG